MKKIENLINYIVYHFNAEPAKLDKIKLAKILWFCEREFMYKTHRRLSNLEFIRLQYGPAPKKYNHLLKQLEDKGILHSFEIPNLDQKQISFHSLKEPNINEFDALEISIIDSVLYDLKDKDTQELSNLSHDTLWKHTKDGDTMPVESVFMKDIQEPDEEDIAWALESLAQKGLYDHQNAQ